MLFAKRNAASPAKVLRLIRSQEWRQSETLRVTQRPRWDATPGAQRLVIRRQTIGELALTPMRWGLAADRPAGEPRLRPLNTIRVEALAEQWEWRRLLNSQRCLVPVDQFYEWKRIENVKTREFAFKLKSGRPMMIAALWNRAQSGVDSFAYISCAANTLVSLIHDRMPAILDETSIATWFNPDAPLESLLSLLKPLRQSDLEAHPVSQPHSTARPSQPSLFDRRAA